MSKLNSEEAKAKIQKMFPSRTIRWVTNYQGYWYVLAPDDKDLEEGLINPYFKVNDSTGAISEFYITKDFPLFDKVVSQAAAESKQRGS